MRKHKLLAATALGLAFSSGLALVPFQSRADTTVSSATTTPLVTSTSGNTTVSSGASITLTSGTAITVDSDNTVDLEGDIAMSSSDSNSTGILITDVPNRTSALTIGGTITVTDDYTATDTTSLDASTDGYVDAPWAEGTGRYGIHSVGTSAFAGDVDITSTIDVEGNSSWGIRWENNVNGKFTYDGSMTLIGDNSTGLALEKGVTGNVYLSGSITAVGQNASAISLTGDIGGNLIIDGSYTGTAYSSTSALTQAEYENLIPANNLLQSGTLVTIASNVANGVLFGASVTSTDDDNTDEDGDGLTDSDQSTASLVQYGSASALLIGSTTENITFGGLTYASTAIDPPSVNYGLLIRGSIAAYGVHPGVTSNAITIGGTGYTTTIDNGIGLTGTVTSTAYGADTTAISLLSGATTPRLDINGTVTATTTRYNPETDDVYSVTKGDAYAISIASGATLPTINVGESSGIYASSTGSTGSATAILDKSGTLTSITNNGTISATITATDDDGDGTTETITGSATAIDVSANTTGVTIAQVDTATDDDDIAAPYIYGNIKLGSGNDTVSSSGGYIYGNIDYGSGTGNFTLSDAATYVGKVTSTGDIAIDIDGESKAGFSIGSALKTSTVHVGDGSTLALALDTTNPTSAILTGSGVTTFDDGAILALTLNNILTTPKTFTLLTASTINMGTLTSASLDGAIPYLYHVDLSTNTSDTTLYAGFRLKTQAEGEYSANEYAALLPVLTAISNDEGATTSLTLQTTKAGFNSIYDQYLPDYSGENLLTLSQGSASLNRSLGSLTLIPTNGDDQYWLQEYGYQTTRDYGETAGFKSTGFSFAAGREKAVYGNQTLGTYISITSSSPLDTFAIAKSGLTNSDLTAGGYWRINRGQLKAWAHAGAGYTQFDSTRELLTSYVKHIATAKWDGYSLSGGAGASYDYAFGNFGVTPQLLVDYYGLQEAKHSESGGGDYFDLTIAKRTGHLLSSTATANFSYNKYFVKPEVWVGYKQNLSATIADTTAAFANGDPFTLTGGNIKGGGPTAGFRVSADNEYSYFSLEGSYEKIADYTNYSIALRTRFQF